MSKRVNNFSGKKYARRHARHRRRAVESLHVYRVRQAAKPGRLARMLKGTMRALFDLREGSRSTSTGWGRSRRQQPERQSEREIIDWRAKRGDREAIRKLKVA